MRGEQILFKLKHQLNGWWQWKLTIDNSKKAEGTSDNMNEEVWQEAIAKGGKDEKASEPCNTNPYSEDTG